MTDDWRTRAKPAYVAPLVVGERAGGPQFRPDPLVIRVKPPPLRVSPKLLAQAKLAAEAREANGPASPCPCASAAARTTGSTTWRGRGA